MKNIQNIEIYISTDWDKYKNINEIIEINSDYEHVEVHIDGDIYEFGLYSQEYWDKVEKNKSHPLTFGYAIMQTITKSNLVNYIMELLNKIDMRSTSYDEFSKELSKIWFWEFDDYDPNPPQFQKN